MENTTETQSTSEATEEKEKDLMLRLDRVERILAAHGFKDESEKQ